MYGNVLHRDLDYTFVQMPHIPRCLQQQIHQTRQLTRMPPSVQPLQLYLHLSENARRKNKSVNEKEMAASTTTLCSQGSSSDNRLLNSDGSGMSHVWDLSPYLVLN